ncbi:MAG: hypothetical protein FD174_2783 [Geobacteraceae bacterium]|nr:MAG: hypothetical protein FD174_2783 [Geobacteraceae bacterium]
MTCKRYFHITGRDLVYLKFIMEAYEGVATLSTADKRNGVVVIAYSDFFAETVNDLLATLREEISLVEVEEPSK